MKLVERTKAVKLAAHNYLVRIIFTNDVVGSRISRTWLLGDFIHNNMSQIQALHCSNGTGFSHLYFAYDVTPDVMAHEIYHCIWTLHEFIGAKHENEIVAYLLSYLMDETEKFRKKAKKSLTRK